MSLLVVDQFYQTRVNDEFVLKGNSVVVKCILPSFVADFVQVISWLEDDSTEYLSPSSANVVNYGKKKNCLFFKILFMIMK